MAQQLIKIRAKLENGKADIKTLTTHPMETGLRKDAAGKTIPLHFIQSFTVSLNDKVVVDTEVSQSLSTNPLLSFRVGGAKTGDKVTVAWTDNKGEKSSETVVLS